MSLSPGTRLGPYEILAPLGAGGMGEVYRAKDSRLGRQVALKVLPADVAAHADRLARFEREARTVAALSHPNIVVLHSVEDQDGTRFLTMELVEGKSLDQHVAPGGMPPAMLLEIAIEMADALTAAHEKGVVHRDLKPANVMLTREGRVKVLDFGLAKLATEGSVPKATQAETVTMTRSVSSEGHVVGTVPYMAPEQVRGEALDERSDLFALGIMLYELATGSRPFTGATTADVCSSILRDTPVALTSVRSDLSGEFERIVGRCLEKTLHDRYQTARDLLGDLRALHRRLERGLSAAAPPRSASPPDASIAVLPFMNRSQNTDDEYFSDGLSEDLINALTAAGRIQVASRTSAFRFRGGEHDIRDIGAQLNVACLLEGSVRRSGSKLRVTAQLVNVASGFQLWSEHYDREMTDVFQIQDEITASIIKALVPALTGDVRRPMRGGTKDLGAYQLYLKGRHYWNQRSPAAVGVAIQSFEQAIALDPNFALAYCGLADCYGILRVYGWTRAEKPRALAAAAVAKAMALDPMLGEANFSKGFYQLYFERRWRDARSHFARARALNPQSSLFQIYSGLLAAMERKQDEALRFIERGCELDPLSPYVHMTSACALFIMGRFEEAAASAQRALELQAEYLQALSFYGLSMCALERFDEGIAPLQRSLAISRAPLFIGLCGLGLACAGRDGETRQLLSELEERSSRGEFVMAFARLCIFVGLRELPAIRRELANTLDEDTVILGRGVINPFIDAYRTDPEVGRLLDAWDRGSLSAGGGE